MNPSCDSHVSLAVLILEIIPKTIWNRIIAFFYLLIRKDITHLGKKHLNEHIICYIFSFLIDKSLINFIKFITQSYLFTAFEFIFTFSVFLKSPNNYFFRWLTYKALLSRFSVLINFSILCGLPIFFCIHPPTFFIVLVFQGPGFSGSRFFWV